MRALLPRTALLAALLLAAPPPAPAADPPDKLRDSVLEPAFQEDTRVKAAASLSRADPEMLGNALLELGEKRKDARNLGLLVRYVCGEETRHLRLVATWAAWQTAPEAVIGAFIEKTASEDERHAIRAVEALGLLAPVLKDRTAYPRLFEIARGDRTYAGIEAARAANRAMDPRLSKDLVDAVCATPDDHVRKHLVWALVDLEKERGARSRLEPLRGRPGDAGTRAREGVNILDDKQSSDFDWRPTVLREVPEWWRNGRPKGLKVELAFPVKEQNEQVQGWLDELQKATPAWAHFVKSTIHKVAIRSTKAPEIYDTKRRALYIDAGELVQCDTPWKGTYVIVRDAGIVLGATLGEPATGHRGWEAAYVDLHAYIKASKRDMGKLQEFVDGAVAKKPWP